MMNDERWTTSRIFIHQTPDRNNKTMLNSIWNNETINRSNYKDILCMLNVKCWEPLHSTLAAQFINFWFSQTTMMMMIFIHRCWLPNQCLIDYFCFCLFATYKMVFRICFRFLLSIVDFDSRFMIATATMSLSGIWSSILNTKTVFLHWRVVPIIIIRCRSSVCLSNLINKTNI